MADCRVIKEGDLFGDHLDAGGGLTAVVRSLAGADPAFDQDL
jgi:hypothetical protein